MTEGLNEVVEVGREADYSGTKGDTDWAELVKSGTMDLLYRPGEAEVKGN